MQQALSPDLRSWTVGRKLAKVSGGGLAIVPLATHYKDWIYTFTVKRGNLLESHLLVLRPYLKTKGSDYGDLHSIIKRYQALGWNNAYHFKAVGLAWIGEDCAAFTQAMTKIANRSRAPWMSADMMTIAMIH
jgi:hypothetical protein